MAEGLTPDAAGDFEPAEDGGVERSEGDAAEPAPDAMEPARGAELEPVRSEAVEPARSKELTKYTPLASHGHERRFHLTYAFLGGLGLAAIAAAAIFVVAGRPPKPPAWSPWKPSASGDAALSQIADHVAPNYRLPTGEQLVAVDGGPLQIAGFPVKIVLVRTPNDYTLADGKGAMFTLCGLGANCSIKAGKPSVERMLLLRREALELALYTFRYVGDVKQVVVLLPPAPGHKPTYAMFFRRDDVRPELSRPLHKTLAPKPPSIPSLRKSRTAAFIDRLTGPEIYNFNLTQAQDASVLLELSRFNLGNQGSSGGGSGGSSSSGK